jgi:CRP-like cAMP-binding protein
MSLLLQPAVASDTERLFPTVTASQIARIAAHGQQRPISCGEILLWSRQSVPSFVVVSGEVRILRPSSVVETLIVVHRPGEVLGESNMRRRAGRSAGVATSRHRACTTSQALARASTRTH